MNPTHHNRDHGADISSDLPDTDVIEQTTPAWTSDPDEWHETMPPADEADPVDAWEQAQPVANQDDDYDTRDRHDIDTW